MFVHSPERNEPRPQVDSVWSIALKNACGTGKFASRVGSIEEKQTRVC